MRAESKTVLRVAGELLVIVVGVLIALSADGWVAERTARRVEVARVEALRANVRETVSRLEGARAEAVGARDALRELASITEEASFHADSLIVLGLMYGTASFEPELNVYDDLKSSGELALLQNTQLRQALAGMDATLERVRLHQADLLVVQQLTYDPYVIDELDLVRLIGPRLSVAAEGGSDAKTLDIARVRNLAVFKLNLVDDLIRLYDEAATTLADVTQAMTQSPK